MATTTPASKPSHSCSLKDELNQALPAGLRCSVQYLHTPPKPCEPIFSALPGQEAEKTLLASHFLSVSIDASTFERSEPGDVMSFAVEVLAYSSRHLTTLFVSKVDSTAYTPKQKPSPIKTTVTTFLRWLCDKTRRKHPRRKVVISLFARAQAQYLFPGSSDDKRKHVLDDRQLIKWWARTLDPIFPNSDDLDWTYQGWLTVPSYAGNELRLFMPPPAPTSAHGQHWLAGHPLLELAKTRGLPEHAPPRCLLPRFPDDPKARFIQELDEEMGISQDSEAMVSPSKRRSGRWKSVKDLERFWEAMEFRQECSSGRVVGFLWLVITPKTSSLPNSGTESGQPDSQESLLCASSSDGQSQEPVSATNRSTAKKSGRKPGKLTGPIIPRAPRLKGGSSSLSNLSEMQAQLDSSTGDGIVVSKEGYDTAMQTLLHLDFSSLKIAAHSTAKWTSEISSIVSLGGDIAMQIEGSAKPEIMHGTAAGIDSISKVNDLGGMLRKKRKTGDGEPTAAGETVVAGGQEMPSASIGSAVNVLGAGMVRKKPKRAAT